MGLHQPGHHAVHRVFRRPQVRACGALAPSAGANGRGRFLPQESGGPPVQGEVPHSGLVGAGAAEGETHLGGSSCRPADLLTSSLSLQLLCILGNDVINEIYEARCPEGGGDKPRADSRR